MMRLIALILFAITLGCSRKKCFTPPPPTPIRLVNSTGQDLLNPQNPNAYSISDIRIHHLENGITKYHVVALDSSLATNTYLLLNDLSWYAQNGRNFYIQLAYNDIDTIYLRCDEVNEHSCTSFELKEFKYNNVTIPLKVLGGIYAYEVTK